MTGSGRSRDGKTRREQRGWYFYDWANSAFSTTVVTVFLGPYLGSVAEHAADRHGRVYPLGVPVAAGALLAYLGAGATVGLVFLTGGRYLLGAVLFLLANIAFGASVVVYNSFLPQIAGPDERDAVSSRGWAIGYLGGGLLLLVNVAAVLAK